MAIDIKNSLKTRFTRGVNSARLWIRIEAKDHLP
jgi:hypothetical protein